MPQNNALIKAVVVGNIPDVLRLIKITPVNAKGELGKTALHNAVFWESTPDIIINTLLRYDADVNALDDVGLTPLSDVGENACSINDIYADRACKLIENGALWPDTERGRFAWQKLPSPVQQLFTEKLQAYQQQQEQIQAEEKTKAFGVLSGYARNIQENSNSFGASSSTGLHHRNTATELKVFNNF
jgi:hypothetical protein